MMKTELGKSREVKNRGEEERGDMRWRRIRGIWRLDDWWRC